MTGRGGGAPGDLAHLVPGPVPVRPATLAALGRQPLYHRGRAFSDLLAECHERISRCAGARLGERVICWGGSGTSAMESAVANLCHPGSPVLVCVTGGLGQRFAWISKAYGLVPDVIEPPLGTGLDPAALAARLAHLPRGTVVLLQHCDTTTGVLTDLAGVAAAARRHEAVLVVDAIASAGAQPLDVSLLGLDVVLGTSQKGLGGVPGLAFAIVSRRAFEIARQAPLPRFSLDWRKLCQQAGPEGVSGGFTPPVNVVAALVAALREAAQIGFERRWDLQLRLGCGVFGALRELGLSTVAVPGDASPVVTAVLTRSMPAAPLEDWFLEIGVEVPAARHGILRIAHFLEQGEQVVQVLRMLARRLDASAAALDAIDQVAATVTEARAAEDAVEAR
jgi:aspartate aminotransferase-like enzyme